MRWTWNAAKTFILIIIVIIAVRFPGECKTEVQWMFQHLNSDDDNQLSLQELFDLENDRNEKCIKPFIDRCDTDK